jgi:hypothetical protein
VGPPRSHTRQSHSAGATEASPTLVRGTTAPACSSAGALVLCRREATSESVTLPPWLLLSDLLLS